MHSQLFFIRSNESERDPQEMRVVMWNAVILLHNTERVAEVSSSLKTNKQRSGGKTKPEGEQQHGGLPPKAS